MFNFKKEADTEYIDLTDIDVFQQIEVFWLAIFAR